MSINRIPLNVDHYESSGKTGSNGFTREFRSSSSSGRFGRPEPFGMETMMDETERIKNRMKEFEERCRKWREEVFGKRSLFEDDLKRDSFVNDRRVPFGSDTTNTATAQTHRSFIQDTANGAKKYRIDLEIGDYKQNELMLSSNGNTLIIRGDRELVKGTTSEKKTFNREITLPDYVDMSKIAANLIENQNLSDLGSTYNNLLEIEAPIIMEKYQFRRSGFDKSQSPVRVKQKIVTQPTPIATSVPTTFGQQVASDSSSRVESKHESHTSKSTTTTTSSTTTKTLPRKENRKGSVYDLNMNIDENFTRSMSKPSLKSNPELMPGYPVYDKAEGCVVYKFDLSDFDQTDIQLTVTVDRTLEIKAAKHQVDSYGKVYHEFKREIVLEPEVELSLIKNVLHEGILTIKIPKEIKSDGLGSISNNHNLQAPNGFKEIYTDDGVLTKLNADFKGFKRSKFNYIN